jgi:peptide deformylase
MVDTLVQTGKTKKNFITSKPESSSRILSRYVVFLPLKFLQKWNYMHHHHHGHNCGCSHEPTECPCGSGKEYDDCCKLFHKGAQPENALALMKSRYSAYARNLPDYIVNTTHPASPEYTDNAFSWKREISLFAQNHTFHKLVIHDFKEKGSFATVTFTAFNSAGDEDYTYSETSYFEKCQGRWLYRNGRANRGSVPNPIYKHELDLLPFTYYGNPILRKKAEPIAAITDEIKSLVDQMIYTLDAGAGVGLAAPQINHSIRLFIIRTPIEHEDGKVEYGDIKVFINPKLSKPSKTTCTHNEGCLSIPGIRADVVRPVEIEIEYTNLDGETIHEHVKGWEARVIMHENDHINGILYIDRLSEAEKAQFAPYLQKLERRLQNL